MKIRSKWATRIQLTSISLIFSFLAYQIIMSLYVPHLNEKNPLLFFSNDLKTDCELALHRYLKKADEITYSLYSLKDPYIKKRLLAKQASGRLHKKRSGLMHQKILCLDSTLFLGTMNMTPSSIKQDKNMFVGIYSPFLTEKIKRAIRSEVFPSNLMTIINEQKIEISFLPEDKNSLQTLLIRISRATKSIFVAMFYLSHPQICEALAHVFEKGVDVHLFLHTKTKQANRLAELGMDVRFNPNPNLMHLKWMVIDEKILFVGSTNWTKNAFKVNEEAHLWISPLHSYQLKQLQTIWKSL